MCMCMYVSLFYTTWSHTLSGFMDNGNQLIRHFQWRTKWITSCRTYKCKYDTTKQKGNASFMHKHVTVLMCVSICVCTPISRRASICNYIISPGCCHIPARTCLLCGIYEYTNLASFSQFAHTHAHIVTYMGNLHAYARMCV